MPRRDVSFGLCWPRKPLVLLSSWFCFWFSSLDDYGIRLFFFWRMGGWKAHGLIGSSDFTASRHSILISDLVAAIKHHHIRQSARDLGNICRCLVPGFYGHYALWPLEGFGFKLHSDPASLRPHLVIMIKFNKWLVLFQGTLRGRQWRGSGGWSCWSFTLGAVGTRPVALADTLAGLQVVGSVLGAAGQALVHLLVDRAAVLALPPSLAVALSWHTGSMSWTEWIQAVICSIQVMSGVEWWVERSSPGGVCGGWRERKYKTIVSQHVAGGKVKKES